MEHAFTAVIKRAQSIFGAQATNFSSGFAAQYLNIKTRSANRGSKSRSSFANLYAPCAGRGLSEGAFDKAGDYSIERFSAACSSGSELPFGSKLKTMR